MHVFVIALTLFTITIVNNLQAKDTKDEKPQIRVPTRYAQISSDAGISASRSYAAAMITLLRSISPARIETFKILLMHAPKEYREDLRVVLPVLRGMDRKLLACGIKIIKESNNNGITDYAGR